MSNNLDLIQMAPGQTQKEQAHNDSNGQLDAALTSVLTVEFSSSDAVILTASQFRRNVFFQCENVGIDAAGTLTVPSSIPRGIFVVENNTGQSITVTITGQAITAPVIPNGGRALLTCDGSNVTAPDMSVQNYIIDAPSDGKQYVRKNGVWDEVVIPPGVYDFGFNFGDTPGANEILGDVIIGRACTIPADFAGSGGAVTVNPDDDYVITINVNGSSVGTLTIADDGTATFDSGSAPVTIPAMARVQFIGQATPDTSIAQGSFVLLATLD